MKLIYPRMTEEQDRRKKLSTEQIKLAKIWYAMGVSLESIGKQLGVTGKAIKYHVDEKYNQSERLRTALRSSHLWETDSLYRQMIRENRLQSEKYKFKICPDFRKYRSNIVLNKYYEDLK